MGDTPAEADITFKEGVAHAHVYVELSLDDTPPEAGTCFRARIAHTDVRVTHEWYRHKSE